MRGNQQLVARIKKSSKYSYQSPEGEWFEVSVHPDLGSHTVYGNLNQYRLTDLAFGVRLENGDVVPLPMR
ncbi:hypothetical protein [Bradyrhizobium ottawaense]|uniref:hypothetical protein n=1 Tax=Bradyrhizobium ottawaense TaxID=931866 RepID=UPI0030F3DA33